MTTLTRDIAELLEAALAKPACDTTRGALSDAMQDADCWTREAILPWVLRHRDNDAPRLLFASWCEGNGEPQRGEFIRVQCRIAQIACDDSPNMSVYPRDLPELDKLRRRGVELLGIDHANVKGELPNYITWFGPDASYSHSAKFSPRYARGFVGRLSCSAADWLKHGDAIVAEQPIVQVRLTMMPVLSLDWVTTSRTGNIWEIAKWPGIAFELPTTTGTALRDFALQMNSMADEYGATRSDNPRVQALMDGLTARLREQARQMDDRLNES